MKRTHKFSPLPQLRQANPAGLRAFQVAARIWVCGVTVVLIAAAGLWWAQPVRPNAPQDQGKDQAGQLFKAFDRPKIHKNRVPGGSEKKAQKYYARVAEDLKFPGNKVPETIDGLLGLLGYVGLKAEDVERLDPKTLMSAKDLAAAVADPAAFRAAFQNAPLQKGEILSTRFFAPKTSDVSGRSKLLSWRKLVYLRARNGSPAKANQVDGLYWLSNTYKPLEDHPFKGHAQNNQVIVVTRPGANLDPIYYLVYDSLATGGKLTTYTATTWDAANPSLEEAPLKKYYAPTACTYCHGEQERRGLLSYLDTDHWLDRVQKGDDFERVGKSPWAVLFDGGKDQDAAPFKEAFATVRLLNQQIYNQNKLVAKDSHMTRAAAKWLKLHEQSDRHVPPLERGIPGLLKPSLHWQQDDPIDRQLLPLLNRYCYRCHSTLYFHVFDKEMFLEQLKNRNVGEELIKTGYMPQDRVLDTQTRETLIATLRAFQKKNLNSN